MNKKSPEGDVFHHGHGWVFCPPQKSGRVSLPVQCRWPGDSVQTAASAQGPCDWSTKKQRHQPRIDGRDKWEKNRSHEVWRSMDWFVWESVQETYGASNLIIPSPCCWISQEQTPNSKLLIPRWIWPILGRYNYQLPSNQIYVATTNPQFEGDVCYSRSWFSDFPLLKYAKVSYSHPNWHLCASKKWGDRSKSSKISSS